ncbi:DUF3085 domain-containing protein (plasmid) [Actinacidiphila glaucinigra]|uniref:DUF3085 domain-containing protein n=1 Tax=Actinacidiphila glaucinigra TaxID=235986 RepID=UPI002DDB94F5|nr:DUF3085 domain-containing protein [Actinacidiphila glaucinigra]WSD65772.1 DUF3085 domain-containing protein [Actinacidiphila glaucinigra]
MTKPGNGTGDSPTGQSPTPEIPQWIRDAFTLDPRPDWLTALVGDAAQPDPAAAHHPSLAFMPPTRKVEGYTLQFPLKEILAAAEDAAAAPSHRLPYGQTDPTPQLWWVKDDGTYLMSNRAYPQKEYDRDEVLPNVVYAEGWGRGTDPRSVLGGDDFCEPIDLLTAEGNADGVSILEMLRDGVADGRTLLLLTLTYDGHGDDVGMMSISIE